MEKIEKMKKTLLYKMLVYNKLKEKRKKFQKKT